MTLDSDSCYRALRTRDARFDGRFFTAVKSTGVYCRPICPARTPRRENCVFLPCAAAAAEAGYRPCLRCRPEAAPGTPAWMGTSATVSRALRLIGDGALDRDSVDALAARLGVGERHLRRLFLEHLGAAPLAVAQTRRLHFAKKLLDETTLPMSQIAFASGFSSIRRFNDAVRGCYGRSPRELRGKASPRATSPDIVLRLSYRPPFDWAALVDFLSTRAIPGVEHASRDGYARSIRVADASGDRSKEIAGVVEVRPGPAGAGAGHDHVVARLRLSAPAPLVDVAERLRRVFDLCADPNRIAADLGADRTLRARIRKRPGLRVPGAWSGFELAVRAILGQQVSVRGATTLAGRLVDVHGEDLPDELARQGDDPAAAPFPTRLFPRPEALLDLDPKPLGLTRARARAISSLAHAVANEGLDLEASPGLDESVAALCALPGVGAWTAHYVAMRALREPDAFPASDLGLRRALGDASGPLSAPLLQERAEAWRPWRAYAAMHLWTG